MGDETLEQMMARAWEEGAEAFTEAVPRAGALPSNPYEPAVKMVKQSTQSTDCQVWGCTCGRGGVCRDNFEQGVLTERARWVARKKTNE
jgi:hypothetical protein